MAPVEECKARLIAQGGVETLVRLMKYDVHPTRERQGRPVNPNPNPNPNPNTGGLCAMCMGLTYP